MNIMRNLLGAAVLSSAIVAVTPAMAGGLLGGGGAVGGGFGAALGGFGGFGGFGTSGAAMAHGMGSFDVARAPGVSPRMAAGANGGARAGVRGRAGLAGVGQGVTAMPGHTERTVDISAHRSTAATVRATNAAGQEANALQGGARSAAFTGASAGTTRPEASVNGSARDDATLGGGVHSSSLTDAGQGTLSAGAATGENMADNAEALGNGTAARTASAVDSTHVNADAGAGTEANLRGDTSASPSKTRTATKPAKRREG